MFSRSTRSGERAGSKEALAVGVADLSAPRRFMAPYRDVAAQ